MAIITKLPSRVREFLDLDTCYGQWTPDGLYVFRCGLCVGMDFANRSAHWWGPSLTEMHEIHHQHDTDKECDIIEHVENLGVMSRIRFWCSCKPKGD